MIRKATLDDLDGIMVCINDAKGFLKKSGSTQWQADDGYPDRSILNLDIINDEAFVCIRDNTICGVAIFSGYEEIYNQANTWLTKDNNKYTTIHRMAVSNLYRGHGVAHELFKACEDYSISKGNISIRIDTHPKNKIMQHIVTSIGYSCCGMVSYPRIKEEPERLIYEKII